MVIPVTTLTSAAMDLALPASTPRVGSYKISRRGPGRIVPSFYELFCRRQLQACSVQAEEFMYRRLPFVHHVKL